MFSGVFFSNLTLNCNYYSWVMVMNKQNLILIIVFVLGVIGFYLVDSYLFKEKKDVDVEISELSYVEINVSGCVLRSGSYKLPATYTIKELFLMVGLKDEADITGYNVDEVLVDKMNYYVPAKIEEKIENNTFSSVVNINTASVEELMSLDGVGETIAKRIILYRETKLFSTIEEIKNVSGIGDKVYEKIKDRITV